MDLNLFKNPENKYRIAPFWSWNDKLNKEELIRQIDEMHKQGYGGFFMHSRVGLVTKYLSEDWMSLTDDCINRASELGMKAWLYDEDKWPSGYASGVIPKMGEEYREQGIVFIDENKKQENDIVVKEVNTAEGKKLICRRIAKLGNGWFNLASYIDTFNPDVIKAFLDSTHGKYKKELKNFNKVEGVFTDEPCYCMHCFYVEPFVPWSYILPEYFSKSKGYRIENRVEQLFLNCGDYLKTRCDFYDCISTLFLESYTKQYAQWCTDNDVKLTGHIMAEDSLVSQTCWIGSAMPHYEYMHQPGVDKLFKNIDQLVTIKQLTSVTEQLNKERALSECFAGLGHDSGFSMRKWIADWQAINGINYINPHLSLYSMRGERKRDYPPNLFYQQPWWDEEKLFSDYASRLNIIASTGKRSVRVLVLHTISSVWAEFNPCERDKGYPSAACYDKEFDVLAMQLQANRIDFHFGDETILAKHAHVVDGKISIGDYLYDTVILPPALTFKCSTIELLEAVQDSIELFSLGRKYDRVDGIKSEKSIKYSKCFENTNELMVHMIESGYSEIDVKSIVTNISNPKVIASIRDDEDGAFVLISNSDRIECSDTIITIKRSGIPLLFSISKGSVAAIPYLLIDGNIQIRAELFESGSIALFIAKDEITALKYCSNLTAASVISSDGAVINGDVIFKPMCTLNNFVATILDNNILPLSIVKFWVKGELIMENAHLSKIWHYHYYKLLDGTPFSAEYAFEVIEIPSGDIFAAIESAENLDRITLNGIEVKSLRSKGELQVFDDKAFIDVSFSKVNLTGKLVKGTNILRIEGMKINNVIGVGSHVTVDDHENYFPTELETIYIEGKFKVSDIDSKDFFIDAYNDYVNPSDITKNGYPFYAGRISYSLKAKLPSSSTVLLYLSDLCGTSASLYFGSRKICSAGWAPYVFDVTEFAGEELEFKLIITNDLYNLMGPVYIKNLDSEPWVNPGIFNDYSRYTKKSNLKSFGLGSVVVLGG